MTPWERKLWYLFLKNYPTKIYRQRIVGSYIIDFYCAKARLGIELDGSQHYMPQGMEDDSVRSENLAQQGVAILRFPNIDIDRHFQAVCDTIHREIMGRLQS